MLIGGLDGEERGSARTMAAARVWAAWQPRRESARALGLAPMTAEGVCREIAVPLSRPCAHYLCPACIPALSPARNGRIQDACWRIPLRPQALPVRHWPLPGAHTAVSVELAPPCSPRPRFPTRQAAKQDPVASTSTLPTELDFFGVAQPAAAEPDAACDPKAAKKERKRKRASEAAKTGACVLSWYFTV